MYVSTNKLHAKFSKLLRRSISALPEEGLKDDFSYKTSQEQRHTASQATFCPQNAH